MTRIAELYGISTETVANWREIIEAQQCPFLRRKCQKIRKSEPDVTIGSCTLAAGRERSKIMICPFRLLERNQIFMDCIHLLTLHEPGNELHIVPELNVPGGSIDYCLVSVKDYKPVDFAGIELQTLDSTGTAWPERQRFAHQHGVQTKQADRDSEKSFGMNWKHTAKTILVQLHHKIDTFEHVSKHLVLVAQDYLVAYMKREFSFDHLQAARLGDPMHFHSYALEENEGRTLRLKLAERMSTDGAGVAKCLGLEAEANVELQDLLRQLELKISAQTLMSVEQPPPATSLIDEAAEDGD